MSETYTVSAKTVDEAVDLASKLYGGKNKEISHDIITLPKKGFLGIGSKNAVIRVTVTDADDDGLASIVNEIKSYKNQPVETGYYTDSEADKRNETKKPEEKKASQPKEAKVKPSHAEKAAPQPEKKEETKAEQIAKPQRSEKPQQKKNKKPASDKPAKPTQTEKAEKAPKSAPRNDEVRVKSAVSEDEMNFAIGFIDAMIANMHLSAKAVPVAAPEGEEYSVTEKENVYPAVNIEGDDTGILIGHHGETLDAVQYLVNLALFRRSGGDRGGRDSIKITVDIENYRAKREETLRALARRMAARAVKYKRNVFLEPMNPYERRIIHSELQEYPDVATHSVGSDTNRKIIITYEGADKASGGKRRSRGKNRGGNSASQSAAEPQVAQALPLPTLDDID